MTVKERQNPGKSESGRKKAAAKEARLADALRANLAKRKDQARARAEAENSRGKPPRSA